MAADNNLRVDPQLMHGFAQALLGGAENLRNQLAGLSILARAVAHAGAGYQHTEAVSTQAIRQVHGG